MGGGGTIGISSVTRNTSYGRPVIIIPLDHLVWTATVVAKKRRAFRGSSCADPLEGMELQKGHPSSICLAHCVRKTDAQFAAREWMEWEGGVQATPPYGQ